MTTPQDGELDEYATDEEVNGIRRTLDSFMKTQEQCNVAMENTLEKILGKFDKLYSTDTAPVVEDKGSNAKSKPTIHANKSLHFGPPQQPNTTYYYTPPDSTRAQFVQASDTGLSTTAPEMITIDYDLHDYPWTDVELEAFYELANRDMTPLHHHSDPVPQKQSQPFLSTHAPNFLTITHQTVNLVQQHFQSQMQFQQKMVAKGPKLSFPEFDGAVSAEKFFELVAVPSEDKVKVAVMYLKGKADYWWRGTGCNPSTLPCTISADCWRTDFWKFQWLRLLASFITSNKQLLSQII